MNEKNRTILIADDDPMILSLVQSTLESKGYFIVTANDGAEALSIFKTALPDLVVLDLNMPHLTGLEVCQLIKTDLQARAIPVMILTSEDNIDQKIAALEIGADDYLTKPFNPKELQARVKNLIKLKNLYTNLETKSKELLKTQKALIDKERQNAVNQLAGGVAHELGQPISAILLNCFILEQDKSPSKAFKKEIIAAIKADAQRLAETIKRLRENEIDASKREEYHRDSKVLKLNDDLLKLRKDF